MAALDYPNFGCLVSVKKLKSEKKKPTCFKIFKCLLSLCIKPETKCRCHEKKLSLDIIVK